MLFFSKGFIYLYSCYLNWFTQTSFNCSFNGRIRDDYGDYGLRRRGVDMEEEKWA